MNCLQGLLSVVIVLQNYAHFLSLWCFMLFYVVSWYRWTNKYQVTSLLIFFPCNEICFLFLKGSSVRTICNNGPFGFTISNFKMRGNR
uniref:Uncharacterized protein n=1 Tax=Rhizophora mucronata TaxID=61149 RepID=A0A2P2NFP8_RHIMU